MAPPTVIAWRVTLAAIVMLPLVTRGENVDFAVAGFPLHIRFMTYAATSLLLLCLLAVSLRWGARIPRSPVWIVAAGFFVWLLVTSVASSIGPIEWVPTLLRWSLYLSVLMLAAVVGGGSNRNDALRGLVLTCAAAVVVPLAVGFSEALLGTAEIRNSAPRISGTLGGHPVAFSLLLASTLLLTFPLIASQRKSRHVLLGSLLVVAIWIGIILTYTRLTLGLAILGIVVIVALHPRFIRRRLLAVAVSVCASVLIVVAALPFLEQRFSPDSGVVAEVSPSADPKLADPADPVTCPDPDDPDDPPRPCFNPGSILGVPLDNSMRLRILIHERGLSYIVRSPVIGHGTGSFDRLFEEDTARQGVAAHNDFLAVAVEAGLPGLALMLALYGLIARSTWVAFRREDGRWKVAALGAGAAFIFINILGAIHNPLYFPEFQIAIWAAVGLVIGQLSTKVRSA